MWFRSFFKPTMMVLLAIMLIIIAVAFACNAPPTVQRQMTIAPRADSRMHTTTVQVVVSARTVYLC
jgi:hypothetical protein